MLGIARPSENIFDFVCCGLKALLLLLNHRNIPEIHYEEVTNIRIIENYFDPKNFSVRNMNSIEIKKKYK